jgi:hypothetical protein
VQDELQVQQRRAAERVLLTAIDRHQGGHEGIGVPVPGKQFQVAAGRLLDVIGQHRGDELVLAGEVGVERAPGQPTGGRDRLDAGAADPMLGEGGGGRLEQPLAGLFSRRSNPCS